MRPVEWCKAVKELRANSFVLNDVTWWKFLHSLQYYTSIPFLYSVFSTFLYAIPNILQQRTAILMMKANEMQFFSNLSHKFRETVQLVGFYYKNTQRDTVL